MSALDYGHANDSNIYYDDANTTIIVPNQDEIKINDPADYMNRINQISSGRERLIELLISTLDHSSMTTHEARYIRLMGIAGFLSGYIYGGFIRNSDATAEYVRKFNAATFEGKTLARKHYTDTYLTTAAGRGFKYAIGGGLLCATAGTIAFGSLTYRNELYYPDWALGFTTFGATTRFWSLGLRGAIGGGGLGLIAGTLGYGLASLYCFALGQSISEIRYNHHREYLAYRDALRHNFQRVQETNYRDAMRRLE